MQKFLFAVKVFGIIILIPVLVILEINHGLPESKIHSSSEEKVEKKIIRVTLNTEAQKENSDPDKILGVLTAPVN